MRKASAQHFGRLTGIPPFDHPDVAAGQGTIGLELVEDLPELACVLIPLSGGGLAAGITVAVKALRPSARIIGISMERGAAMAAALAAGRPVEVVEEETLADSLGAASAFPTASPQLSQDCSRSARCAGDHCRP